MGFVSINKDIYDLCSHTLRFFLTISRKNASICKVLTEDSRYLSFQLVSQYLAKLRKQGCKEKSPAEERARIYPIMSVHPLSLARDFLFF